MNVSRRVIQLLLDINKIQTEVQLKFYGQLGFYRRLYVACGFPEDTARRLEAQVLALGHEGAAEQHEILSRFVRAEIGLEQLVHDLSQWFSGYMDHCREVVLDELQHPC